MYLFRIHEHRVAGRYVDIPDFYKSLIIVSFKPKFKTQEQKSKFDLVLGKKCMYNMVCRIQSTWLHRKIKG